MAIRTTWIPTCTAGCDAIACPAIANTRIATMAAKPRLRDRSRQAWTAGSDRATSQKRMIGSSTSAAHTAMRPNAITLSTVVGTTFAATSAWLARKAAVTPTVATIATTCHRRDSGISESR